MKVLYLLLSVFNFELSFSPSFVWFFGKIFTQSKCISFLVRKNIMFFFVTALLWLTMFVECVDRWGIEIVKKNGKCILIFIIPLCSEGEGHIFPLFAIVTWTIIAHDNLLYNIRITIHTCLTGRNLGYYCKPFELPRPSLNGLFRKMFPLTFTMSSIVI